MTLTIAEMIAYLKASDLDADATINIFSMSH